MKARNSIAFLALLVLSTSALAVDGVYEINQECALNGGCFAGDAAGFPVQITSPGSYVLTGDLSATASVSSMILVGANEVRLDLNGFKIDGGGTCTGFPVTSCSGGLSTYGIQAFGARIHVSNGIVRGMEDDGISQTGNSSRLSNLHVRENGRHGALMAHSAVVDRVTAANNGQWGISINNGSMVTNSDALANGSVGITTVGSARISGCVARSNGSNGIAAGMGSTVSDSVARDNSSDGISVTGGSHVFGNTLYGNASNGINLLLDGNSARDNHIHHANATGYAMNATSSTSTYAGNTIYITGTTPGSANGGTNAGGNYCNGAVCP